MRATSGVACSGARGVSDTCTREQSSNQGGAMCRAPIFVSTRYRSLSYIRAIAAHLRQRVEGFGR